MSLLRRKRVGDLQAEAFEPEGERTLRRALGPLNLTTLGIGAIMGAGVFILTGQAAARYAGPGITLSFLLAGTAAALAGLCYAELSAMIPIAGSAYTYAYATLGELLAWIIGWDLILEYLLGAATVAVGWSAYAVSLLRDLGIDLAPALVTAPLQYPEEPAAHRAVWRLLAGEWVHGGAIANLPAMLIILVMSVLLILGIRESARFNSVVVVTKLLVVLAVVVFGLAYVRVENWHPFVPPSEGPGRYGWSGVVRGAGVIFFAYVGFDAVSTAAQEATRPQRDLPIGILGSLGICTVLYIAVALVLTGIVSYTRLGVPDPFAVGIDAAGPGLAWLRPLVKIGAIAGLSSVILVMLLGQPRIFYAMSRDGLLPPLLGRVHPRFRTPWIASVITGLAAMLLAGFLPLELLGELVSIGTLLAFGIVCAGVLVLRWTDPSAARPFRTPLVPVIPVLGVLACGYLMSGLPVETWVRLFAWMGLGLVVYVGYGRRHSRVAGGGPRAQGPSDRG